MIGKRTRYIVIYLLIVVGMAAMFLRLPTSFLPDEDQGVMFTMVQLPAGATLQRTQKVVKQVQDHFANNEKEAVKEMFAISGFSMAGSGQNVGMAFIKLKDWDERKRPDLKVKAIAGRAMGAFSQIRDAMVFAFAPPAVMELGNSSGFDMQLMDRGSVGHAALIDARNMFLGMASQDKRLTAVRPNGQDDTPQYELDIDQAKLGALGVSTADVNDLLATAWGSTYVNDFVDRGRVKKVYVQGDSSSRMLPEDLNKWNFRNKAGEMLPFSAFATGHWMYGSPRLERYNGSSSVEILGQAGPGLSTGDAMTAVEEIAAKLPPGVGFEWTGVSFEERRSGTQAPALYAISLLVVFLSLAALYESWSVPFAVMLVVPLGIIGAVLAASARGMSNDVYFQVGLLTTVGLAAKNAILIVEFAQAQIDQGLGLFEATLNAVRMRLRPILMTSLAFGLGVLPLAMATGAGSGSQTAIGTGVLGGMISATVLGIFFVPVFFVVIRLIFKGQRPTGDSTGTTDTTPTHQENK
jgi:multidrug efflux pump